MEKMSIIFYVLTFFGALLVPTFSMVDNPSPTTVNTSISLGPDNQGMDLIVPSTTTVSMETGTAEDISSISQNVTNTSSVTQPSTKGSPKENLTTDSKTTNETKDETTTRSSTEKKSTTKVAPVETTPAPGVTKKESSTTPVPDSSGETGQKSTTKSVPGTNDKTEGSQGSSSVYIIVILVVICLIIFCIIIFCVYKGDRRRYSVDIHAKNEDAQIPLALVEPDLCDVSPKAMKTFASPEESSPTGTGEKTEEEKAPNEADQQDTKNPGETQTTETSAEKPAEPKSLDVSEEDATPSTKTSVETLNDGLNENNSNNNAVHDVGVCFIDICLND